MGHEAHVWFIDAHAKGNRGHHHHGAAAATGAELIQGGGALATLHAGVVTHRLVPRCLQCGRQPFHPTAGTGVDDARLAPLLFEKGEQLASGFILGPEQIANVGPIKTGQKHPAPLQPQPLHNLAAGARIGRGGERQPRHVGKALRQDSQLDVFRPEIMAPLGYAVGLVDRKQGRGLAPGAAGQSLQQIARQQPLWRHIEQLQAAGRQLAPQG